MLASKHCGWLLLFAIAATSRATYLLGGPLPFETRQTPILGDAAGYAASALVLMGGAAPPALSNLPREALVGVPWTLENTKATLVERGPGYVLFLATLFRAIHADAWVVRWAQALLGSAACLLIALSGLELASRRVGLVAGGLAALHPTLILFTGRILTETLALFLFWLGFLLLVRALRRGGSGGLLAGGFWMALAALTRPTLLVVIPFAWAGAAIGTAVASPGRRTRRLAVFSFALLAPLLIWNATSHLLSAGKPTAGSFGVRVAAHLFLAATSPEQRGWHADAIAYAPGAALHFDALGYRTVAVLNLLFYHVWFLDNVWREVPGWMHDLQRIVFLLALGGLGLAGVEWRRFAPLLALAASTVLASAKYIEIRPLIPLIPVQLLLVGVLVDEIWKAIDARARRGPALALLAGGAAVVIALVGIHRPAELTLFLPDLDAVSLGRTGDLLVGITSLLAGGALYGVMRPGWGARAALVAAGAPALAFVSLYAAYAFVASGPRWRAWELDLDRVGGEIEARIELRDPLPGARIRSAIWFVDLRSERTPPPVRLGIDGNWLVGGRPAWQRFHCNPNDAFQETLDEQGLCFWYTMGLTDFSGAFPGSPQWWFVSVPPPLIADRREVSLRLAVQPGAAAEGRVALGGSFGSDPPGSFYGPVLRVAGASPATSLYRWHVEEDWRLWSVQAVASAATRSRIPLPPETASGRAARLQRLVAAAAAEGRAHLGARLLVEYEDGSRILY